VLRYAAAPPGAGKARLELALDPATFYPLRLQRYGTGGQLISSTVYRQISYGGQPPQRVAVPTEAAPASAEASRRRVRAATPEELTKVLGGPLLKPTYIPAGFTLRGTFLHDGPRRKMAETRYFDGLRTLAVMQAVRPVGTDAKQQPRLGSARAGERPGRQGLWRRLMQARERPDTTPGPKQAGARGGIWQSILRGNVVREKRGDWLVIVVGEVPVEELQKVMASIPAQPGDARPAVRF
jgi:hypothetical protein